MGIHLTAKIYKIHVRPLRHCGPCWHIITLIEGDGYETRQSSLL